MLIRVCAFWRDLMPDQCRRETPPPRSGLRWRRNWGGAGRGAEHRRWDSDGLLATRRRLSPSGEPADDSEPPGSCREREVLNNARQELNNVHNDHNKTLKSVKNNPLSFRTEILFLYSETDTDTNYGFFVTDGLTPFCAPQSGYK